MQQQKVTEKAGSWQAAARGAIDFYGRGCYHRKPKKRELGDDR